MIPRKRLDIGWMDMLFGAGCCLWPGDRTAAERSQAASMRCCTFCFRALCRKAEISPETGSRSG